MEQYRSVKKTLSEDTVLFFRLGDFYEMFFEDAVRASEILDITLTGREAGEAGRVPMCGIPYHAFQGYVRVLLDHNLKVAVCEQIGDPKLAKGLVERKITRIITPATYLDDETKSRSFEYLISLAADGKQFAVSCLELSTGEFFVREIPADRFQSELTLLAPREVVISKTLAEKPELVSFVKDGLQAAVTVYDDWVFELDEGFRFLQEGFGFVSRQSISFHDHPLAVRAAGVILYYLKDHFHPVTRPSIISKLGTNAPTTGEKLESQGSEAATGYGDHSALGHIHPPVLHEGTEFMVLDRQAQRSLELVASLNGGKAGPTLLSTIDQTLTAMGERTLYQWVTHPLLGAGEIENRLEAVNELFNETVLIQNLRGLFKGVKDMERTLSRLSYGVANARDLINLKIFLARVPEILNVLSKVESALLIQTRKAIQPFPDVRSLIDRAIVEEPPVSVKDGGMIHDGFSAELEELREISRKGKSWLLEFEKREIERTGIRSLKIKYSQVFGYTIEVSKSNLGAVPPDYIRRQTLANGERFVVPELLEWDEKISGAQDKIKALEFALFNQVREKILETLAPLQAMAKAVGVLDCLASLALIAVQKDWTRPAIVDSGEILIEGGRHPVVEAVLPAGQFVENDVFLDTAENQLIVLTGPNMAGKSTYIRQVAHIVLLAQMGSFVPAKLARIGLVDRIFTRIGASDDLARGESTFMVEMIETANILQRATRRSLLILDEVGRGTSTFDGVSIAWAICEYLARGSVRPRTLFATHYHELIQLEDNFPGIKNYTIRVKESKDGIIFLRKVVRGGTDRSYGIHVARLAGIPKSVTDRADRILKILESENTEATRIIEGKTAGKNTPKTQPQPDLFEIREANHPMIDELRNLCLDGMTPIEALNKLAELKEKLEGRRQNEEDR